MIKIGVFAVAAQVSIKTLRHYDEMDLLKPIFVDDFSGYRYYALDQLPRLNRILALRDLGFSLPEIRTLLGNTLVLDQIRETLSRKHTELLSQIAEEQARLTRVEARLKQIEQEGKMSDYEIVLKKVAPQWVASVAEVIPNWGEVNPTLNRIFDEVYAYVRQNGGKPAGPAIDLWTDTEMPQANMNVEALAPIESPIPSSARVRVYELPGVETMASTIHIGSFDKIGEAHQAVIGWVEANGSQIVGPGREVSLHYERTGDPSAYVTEIQYPVTRV